GAPSSRVHPRIACPHGRHLPVNPVDTGEPRNWAPAAAQSCVFAVSTLSNEPAHLTSHRELANRAVSARAHPSGGQRPELLRVRARSSLRDHLPAPGTWLFDVD